MRVILRLSLAVLSVARQMSKATRDFIARAAVYSVGEVVKQSRANPCGVDSRAHTFTAYHLPVAARLPTEKPFHACSFLHTRVLSESFTTPRTASIRELSTLGSFYTAKMSFTLIRLHVSFCSFPLYTEF